MRRTRLTTILATLPLAAVACGTATTPTTGDGTPGQGEQGGGITTSPPSAPRQTPHEFAAGLVAGVDVPAGAIGSSRAPSKVLEGLPVIPDLGGTPVVVTKYWTVEMPVTALVRWMQSHPQTGLEANGSGSEPSAGGSGEIAQTFAYRAKSLPGNIAVGDIYLSVASLGSGKSAVAAYALSLPQPSRPATEKVPLDLGSAVIGWSLAPGGTPARKELTGDDARRLARDFNRLRVDVSPFSPCPLIPQQGVQVVVVTFTADGHTWKVDIPACPDITVRRDGVKLPSLAFGAAFLNDIKRYVGDLPHSGPPTAGQVIPLGEQPTRR